MEKRTVPLRAITKDGKTITIMRVIESTPEECLTALINARTSYEFYIVMREIGFTVHVYDDSTSIGLDSVGDVMEFSGDFLDDYGGDNPPYSTLLWDHRYAFIDAYREKVVEVKED
ncbi:hypothetical protein AC069_03555 [Gardnerella vaginalis]|nr:hypothetical protein AC069_03555 [Gardnerella vaginalis]